MILRMRFFIISGAKTEETERVRPTGSPQGRNGKEIARGKPENAGAEFGAGAYTRDTGVRANLLNYHKRLLCIAMVQRILCIFALYLTKIGC